jgi:sugar lactone lactonase YvrE
LAAAACLPLALAATGAGSSAPEGQDPEGVRMGLGEHTYRWVDGWLQVPGGASLGNTHGDLVVDSAGNLYVNTDTEQAVMVFAPDGSFVRSWGAELAGGLHGMALARDGDAEVLWLAHTGRHQVLKATLEGEILQTIDWPEASGVYASANEYKPTGVAVADDGTVFVADGYGSYRVNRFAADGTWEKTFGAPGQEPGQFKTPHGIWIDRRGDTPTLLVADRENGRLQRLSFEGQPLEVLPAELRRPCQVKAQGDWLVVADLAGRVSILDGAGDVLCHLGDNPDPTKRANHGVPPSEWRDGEFTAPHSATWDADGNLFVMDWNATGRVSKLERLR